MNAVAVDEGDFASWYSGACARLSGRGLWLRGGELNTLDKGEYSRRPFKVLFSRLSTYEDTCASFTHSFLYEIAASIPEVFPDIAYLPPACDARVFEKDAVPWLLGTQTKFPARRFNLIGFSNSIIQELVNLPQFLIRSSIPLSRKDRMRDESLPLIILGGASAAFTSAIWGEDSWVDGVFIGDDPRVVKKLLEVCAAGYAAGKNKKEVLADMCAVRGFFSADISPQAGLKQQAGQGARKAEDLLLPEKGLVYYSEEEMGTGYLPLSRGCRSNCCFCAESWLRKPFRQYPANTLIRHALRMKAQMGLEKIDLFSFNVSDHSDFYSLLSGLSGLFRSVSIKSQRFDSLGREPLLIEYQTASGKTIYSCGLEGISARLRRFLNKNLDEKQLRSGFELIFGSKARQLKIFLLATGLEQEDDFSEFAGLLRLLKSLLRRYSSGTRVVISLTPLVRFPLTPLEFDDASALRENLADIAVRIRALAEEERFEFRQAMSAQEWLLSQVLARAQGREIRTALLKAALDTGFVYYHSAGQEFVPKFTAFLNQEGVDLSLALKGFDFQEAARKPWAALDTGVKRKVLWDIYRANLLSAAETPAGPKAAEPYLKLQQPSCGLEDYLKLLSSARARELGLRFAVEFSAAGRGVSNHYRGLVLARALMTADPELARFFRSYISSYWPQQEGMCWVTGDDIVTLGWDSDGLDLLRRRLREADFIARLNSQLGEWGKFKGELVPGEHKEAEFSLEIVSAYEFRPLEYFKSKGVKYETHKQDAGGYSFFLQGESFKKEVVRELSYFSGGQPDNGVVKVSLVPGKKFDITEFVAHVFAFPDKHDWIGVKAVSRLRK